MIRAFAVTLLAAGLAAQEPDLPQGLGKPEPKLPSGLDQQQKPDEPALPSGLGEKPADDGDDTGDDGESWAGRLGITGFLDVRVGTRTQRDPHERDFSIAEARLRLEHERAFDSFVVRLSGDLVADTLARTWRPDLESGEGFLDLREANVQTTPWPWMDVKLGRQVLTWGTGDLVFLNDMFPKDWVSFLSGRDDEYLKAPSDALRVGLFSDLANLEVVATPRFDPDRYLRGDRLSYYDPALGRRAGRDSVQDPIVPDEWGDDAELHLRLSKNVAGLELDGYGYVGRWKSPAGVDPMTGRGTFPRLSVWGASVRTQVAGGVANAEFAYYDSRQDRDGDDPTIQNSQVRGLIGFERDLPEVADALTLGLQYYVEAMLDHGDYLATLPGGMPARDELRHVVTARVTKLLMEQRLRLSLFGFVSPSDHDAYLRPSASYTIDDSWTATIGANVFVGEDPHTFFGQFERNSSVFAAVRMSF
ncbi:MAG: hypothetical protein KDB80_01390 [Planctomycetes bacterium]|nr:hypothetical protein [Planctomycetota bacterium]